MEKSKKIKIFVGLFYLITVSIFLFWFFSNFSINEISNYNFIQSNREYLNNLKNNNLLITSLIFILLVILWIFMLGFGSPVALVGGFIFGKWLGSFLVALGSTFGATLLYIFANYFLKDFIKEKFSKKYKNLEEKFKKNEFNFFLIYRFIGGIPFAISNVLPCIFNVKKINFFCATFIGILPQLFLICSIGSGLEKIIDQNLDAPSMIELITSPDIYIPLIAFFTLLVITIIVRNLVYKK